MTGLTHPLRKCLDAIDKLTVDGVPPSYDELAGELGLSSKSGINRLVTELEGRGYVRRQPGVARSLEIIPRRPPSPAELNRFGTPELLDLLAHVCGILGHRMGPAKIRETLDRIGARLAGIR